MLQVLVVGVVLVFLLRSAALADVAPTPSGETPLAGVAKPRHLPAGAPRYSDVCFSSRFRRPRDANDPHDTLADAAAFHATRLDWAVSADASWIRRCKDAGYHYGGWLSSIVPDDPDSSRREQGRVLDARGERVCAPWMKLFSGYWGCVNSPEYRRAFVDYAKRQLDGGADYFQVDDPDMNVAAIRWGGCFCEACRREGQAQGVDLAKDMRPFQDASLRRFYADMRRQIDAYAGRRVPMSSNNYGGRWLFPYDLFDFGMAELPVSDAKPETIYARQHEAATSGRAQIFTFVCQDVALMRRLIATTYASGGNPIVPYDVYIKTAPGDTGRYFGTPEQYADLFGFVRGTADLLDGYEDAAVAGPGFVDARFGDRPVMMWQGAAGTAWAFARARPGHGQTPVAIHIAQWGEGRPGGLRLRRGRFFAGQRVAASLLVPQAYDAAAHGHAHCSRDYSQLVHKSALEVRPDGEWDLIELPPLTPWGMLVIEPAH